MQAHQGVEDEQPGLNALDGVEQLLAVVVQVEVQGRDVDDGEVKGVERGAGDAGDAFEPGAHDVSGVLGGEEHEGTGVLGVEAAQRRHASGD